MRCESQWRWRSRGRARSRANRRRPRRCRRTRRWARQRQRRWPARRRASAAAAAGEGDAHGGPGDERHDPAVVAREDGGDEREGDAGIGGGVACAASAFKAGAPLDQPDGNPDHLADKERLGHGRGLQIEQVGIEREEGQRQRRGGGRQPVAGEAIDARASGQISQSRGDRCRRCRWPTKRRPGQRAASAGAAAAARPSRVA